MERPPGKRLVGPTSLNPPLSGSDGVPRDKVSPCRSSSVLPVLLPRWPLSLLPGPHRELPGDVLQDLNDSGCLRWVGVEALDLMVQEPKALADFHTGGAGPATGTKRLPYY